MGSGESKSNAPTETTVPQPPPGYDYLFKIMLVGKPGCGKSSLLYKYTEQDFIEDGIRTLAEDFKVKTLLVDNKTIKVQIWDLVKQEKFRTITSSFYASAHGIIACYDITDADSFLELEMWLSEVDQLAPEGVERLVVACKSDLESERTVSQAEAVEFCARSKVNHVSTSAKLGDGVDAMFEKIILDVKKKFDAKS